MIRRLWDIHSLSSTATAWSVRFWLNRTAVKLLHRSCCSLQVVLLPGVSMCFLICDLTSDKRGRMSWAKSSSWEWLAWHRSRIITNAMSALFTRIVSRLLEAVFMSGTSSNELPMVTIKKDSSVEVINPKIPRKNCSEEKYGRVLSRGQRRVYWSVVILETLDEYAA